MTDTRPALIPHRSRAGGGRRYLTRILALVLVAGGLGACAEAELLIHATKQLDRDDTPKTTHDRGEPVPAGYKVGRAYEVAGVWYYPYHDPKYDKTGIASWYGEQFHGRPTANGETFDMNTVTAAHKTMALPSIARVTNLENGRSLLVRVNDRGPFVNGRIIDLSRRSAQLLGVYRKGTAKVRVEFLEFAPLKAFASADSAYGSARTRTVSARATEPEPTEAIPATGGTIAVETVEPPPRPEEPETGDGGGLIAANAAELETAALASDPPIYIQVGAFADPANAARLRGRLARFGPSQISEIEVGGRLLHRVRIGPLSSVRDADETLTLLIHEGFTGARVVVAR